MVLIPEGFREGLAYFNSRDLISNFDVDIVPNDLDNNISGHTLGDVLFGLAGNDRIVGNAGDDTIFGDDGNDVLSGNAGRDLLSGGDGDDRIRGHGGNDSIVGDAGDDTLQGYSGRDEFQGGEGDDLIDGGGDRDTAHLLGEILTEDGEFNYSFVRQGNSRGIVTDLSGVEGTDTLRSIEELKFEDFTIFLDGTNNTPIAFDDELETDEDTAAVFDILGNDVDFDRDFLGLDDDTIVQSINFTPVTGGTLVITPGGASVEFDPGNDFQFLALGEQLTESFTYIVADNAGATDEGFAEITILGVNDAPVTNDFAVSGNEDDTSISFSLAPNSFDIDATDILTYALFGPEEIRGTVNFDPVTGEGELVLSDDFQYLLAGQTEVIELDFKAIDDSGADNDTSNKSTVTITVNGADDADVTMSQNVQFDSNDQSTVQSGSAAATTFDPDIPFLGFSFDESFSTTVIPGFTVDFLGASVGIPSVGLEAGVNGTFGLQPIFSATAGSIDTRLTGSFAITSPNQVIPGQLITLETGLLLDDGSFFNTTGPGVTVGLDLIAEFGAFLNIPIGGSNNFIFNFNEGGVFPLINFTSGDSLTVSLPAGSSVTAEIPEVATTGALIGDSLFGEGEGRVLDFVGDIDGLITALIPPLPDFEGTIPLIPLGIDLGILGSFDILVVEAFYNLLDIELMGDAVNGLISLAQEFEVSLGDVEVVLELENGDLFTFNANDDLDFIVPEDFDVNGNEVLDYGWTLNVNGNPLDDAIGAQLSNLTSLNFDLDLGISALEFGINVRSDIIGDSTFSFGPLVDETFDLIDGDDFLTFFDDQFALLGFNTDTGEFAIDASLLNPSGLAQHDDFIMA